MSGDLHSMSEVKVARKLYRSLLLLAKNFDEAPSSKALLYRTATASVKKSATSQYYNDLLDRFLQKDSHLYRPVGETSARSITSIVKDEFREKEAKIAMSSRIDTGFALLRKLTVIWKFFVEVDAESIVDDLESSEGPRLDACPASMKNLEVSFATKITAGTIILAHPMLQGPLHRSVILILNHSDKGSYGLVINRVTDKDVKSAVKNLPEGIVDTFGRNPVSFGGMLRRVQYIHDVHGVGGTRIPGCSRQTLYAGGKIAEVLNAVKSGRVDVSRFKFFAGCCLWETGELENETAAGLWIPVNAAPDAVLALMSSGSFSESSAAGSVGQNAKVAQALTHDTASKARVGGEEPTRQSVWRGILQSLGEPFSSMSSVPNWVQVSTVESLDWH